MSSSIGISPSVMINRMVHESGTPEAASLAEVAKLRMRLAQAQAEELATSASPEPAAKGPANGAEVDLFV